MSTLTSIPRIITDFRNINPRDYQEVVRFFQRYEEYFNDLDTEFYFPSLLVFTNSLYELGEYELFLPHAERILELSIQENIQFFNGEDIFLRTLYQKSRALLGLGRPEKAAVISRQLLRLAPENRKNLSVFRDCLMATRPEWLENSLSYSIISLWVGLLLMMFNIFQFKPIWQLIGAHLETAILCVWALTLCLSLIPLAIHVYQCYTQASNTLREATERKGYGN